MFKQINLIVPNFMYSSFDIGDKFVILNQESLKMHINNLTIEDDIGFKLYSEYKIEISIKEDVESNYLSVNGEKIIKSVPKDEILNIDLYEMIKLYEKL